MHNPIRYTALICIQTTTPLSIGSGLAGLTNDRLIARDANNLPYIPGTGLAGALRQSLSTSLEADKYFGSSDGNDAEGSCIIISSAHLVMLNGKVADGLVLPDEQTDLIYSILPSRDHVRINDCGVADTENRGKFEEELLLSGSRLVFSVEMLGDGNEDDETAWQKLIAILSAPYFRIGGGTRKGFGAFEVIALDEKKFDLRKAEPNKDFLSAEDYLKHSSFLQMPQTSVSNNNKETEDGDNKDGDIKKRTEKDSEYTHYYLELEACDFFFFGGQELDIKEAMLSGGQTPEFILGVDDNFKTEKVIVWQEDGTGQLSEKQALLPATSVKGALSHRVAFHYNKKQLEGEVAEESDAQPAEDILARLEVLAAMPEDTASDSPLWEERIQEIEALTWPVNRTKSSISLKTGEENEAVLALFGRSAEVDKTTDKQKGQRGRVLVEDCYITTFQEKIFDHVKIDRFTGGASDGALFQEKTITTNEKITLNFWVEKKALEKNEIKDAWEASLHDVANGLLPLGGKTTKGHGLFQGTVYKESKILNQS